MRVIYSGTMEGLEVTESSAWVKVPLSNPAWTNVFGTSIDASINLSITGVAEPNYRSVLFFILLGGWINKRQLDIYLSLAVLDAANPGQPPLPVPDGDWKVDDPNNFPPADFPYRLPQYLFLWGCERVVARPT